MNTPAATLLVTLPDVSQHMYWYMGRSSGFIAYWLLFASVALGLAVSSRVFDGVLGRPWVFEVHKFLSLFVLAMMTFHGLIMLPDPYAKFTLRELLVPFQTEYKNTSMAIGIITLYSSALISLSFYAKGMISQQMWRTIHYLTFALFVAALAHGVWMGTDTEKGPVQFSYLASALTVLFLTFFRILAARSAKAKAVPAAARAKAAA
ncbi:MAG: hypothetical protein HY874_06565 [Chloroflexi bacterium]|nr:hypothetical protein [Chloroflexota bacterium]